MRTTELIPGGELEYHAEPCHGGVGPWYFRDLIAGAEKETFGMRFIHRDKLPAGSAFGVHFHPDKTEEVIEEWYLCLSGHGVMTLDGKDYPFGPGDVTVCRNGGSHGLRNDGDEEMEFLVFCCASSK